MHKMYTRLTLVQRYIQLCRKYPGLEKSLNLKDFLARNLKNITRTAKIHSDIFS